MSRRRILLITLAVLVVLVLAVPLWMGYVGPKAAVLTADWRPWRTHLTAHVEQSPRTDSTREVLFIVQYRDPWPGQAFTPGWQYRVVTVKRANPLLPWVVTATNSGG